MFTWNSSLRPPLQDEMFQSFISFKGNCYTTRRPRGFGNGLCGGFRKVWNKWLEEPRVLLRGVAWMALMEVEKADTKTERSAHEVSHCCLVLCQPHTS